MNGEVPRDSRLRVSDAEREHLVTTLRHHVGKGRLSLEEFSERCTRAYAARTVGDLRALTDDLPRTEEGPASGSDAVTRPRAVLATLSVLVATVLLGGFGAMAAAGSSMMAGMCP